MGVRLVKYGVNNGAGTYNHNDLLNRELPDQHPISAITGLEDRLKQIDIDITNAGSIDNIINTPSLTLQYDKDTKTLTGKVNIFKSEDNALEEKTTGLYVDKYLDIDTEDTASIHLTTEGKGETLKTMYQSGTRFAHNGSWTNIANESEANAWYFDDSLDSFVQPQNTTTFTGFVSTVRYRTYTHRATLKSGDSDNDGNGLIIAYATDEEGYPHTLSVIINKGGESHAGSFYYALVYDKSLPDQQVLFTKGNKENGTIPGNHSTGGWSGATITLEVNKAGSTITCAASNYNSTEINPDTLIEIDLDDYSWGHLFRGKVQYGYCNQSQANSYFKDIYFSGKGPLKATALLSMEQGNGLVIKDDGLYVDTSNIKALDDYVTKQSLEESIDYRLVPAEVQPYEQYTHSEVINTFFYKFDVSKLHTFYAKAGWTTSGTSNKLPYETAGTYSGETNVLCDIYTQSGVRVGYSKIIKQTGNGSWKVYYETNSIFADGTITIGSLTKEQTWYGGTDGGFYHNIGIACPQGTDFETYFGEPCYAIIKSNGAPTFNGATVIKEHYEVTIEEDDLSQEVRDKLNGGNYTDEEIYEAVEEILGEIPDIAKTLDEINRVVI